MSNNYNFDEEDKFVEFVFSGNQYQLWYPTTEEIMDVQEGEDNELEKFMIDHIKPAKENTPAFSTVKDKMTIKQTMRFKEMIYTELGLTDAQSRSTETT